VRTLDLDEIRQTFLAACTGIESFMPECREDALRLRREIEERYEAIQISVIENGVPDIAKVQHFIDMKPILSSWAQTGFLLTQSGIIGVHDR
jgi:hypothetical protein